MLWDSMFQQKVEPQGERNRFTAHTLLALCTKEGNSKRGFAQHYFFCPFDIEAQRLVACTNHSSTDKF